MASSTAHEFLVDAKSSVRARIIAEAACNTLQALVKTCEIACILWAGSHARRARRTRVRYTSRPRAGRLERSGAVIVFAIVRDRENQGTPNNAALL
jgi:hypothetical protein